MQANYSSTHSIIGCSRHRWTPAIQSQNERSQYADTLNNKMSIFSHKDVFVRGMKDAQAYCFWPQTFPSVDVCKSKIALFFPPPRSGPSEIWKQVAGVSSWHRSISSPALPYQRWLVEIRWWGRLQGFHDGWQKNWPQDPPLHAL